MDTEIIKNFLQSPFLREGGKNNIIFVLNKAIDRFFQIKLTNYLVILKILFL